MKKCILYIHQYFKFPSDSGGTRSYDLSRAYIEKGYSVFVITTNSGIKELKNQQEKWQVLHKDGIIVYSYRLNYDNQMNFLSRIKSFIKFMICATFKSLSIKADFVITTSTPLTVGLPALMKKWINKTPYIFEVRDVWPEVPVKLGFIKNKFVIWLLNKFEKLIYNNAVEIVPLSIGMEVSIKSRYPSLINKVTTIPNISEVNRFNNILESTSKILFPSNKKILLYAGTFGYVNGLKYIVELMSYLKDIDDNIWFYVFGNGKEKTSILEYAKNNGVLNLNLFIFDAVPKNELPYLYRNSYMGSSFVIDIPVLWDNSANKFFDTLAAGKPMLINYEGWQADYIRKNNCGFVLPAVLSEENVRSFYEYLSSNDNNKIQSANSLLCAQKDFSLEVASGKYLQIFNSKL